MQIQKIEEELNVLIFDRSKKPIQLTEIGKKIVNQAKNIVNEAGRIKDIVEQEKGFIGGDFRIGMIPTIMPTLLPMFLNTFIKKYPKVNLIVEELNTTDIITKLKNGHLDCAIAATPLDEEKLKEIVLYYEPFVAYIPENSVNKTKKEIKEMNSIISELEKLIPPAPKVVKKVTVKAIEENPVEISATETNKVRVEAGGTF
jgi:LysR family hydrogen peroxide-inducible transcriptional activator